MPRPTAFEDESIFASVEQAAAWWHVSAETVRRWIRSGKLATVPTPGHRILIRWADIYSYESPSSRPSGDAAGASVSGMAGAPRSQNSDAGDRTSGAARTPLRTQRQSDGSDHGHRSTR